MQRGQRMEQERTQSKMDQLISNGYSDTGKTFKIMRGPHKGKSFPVYAQEGDVAGLVYNKEEDKVEFVFKLPVPFKKDAM